MNASASWLLSTATTLALAAGCSASPVVAPANHQNPTPRTAAPTVVAYAAALPSVQPQSEPQPLKRDEQQGITKLKTGRFVPVARILWALSDFGPTVLAATSVPGGDDEFWFVGGVGLRLHYMAGRWSGTQTSGDCAIRIFKAVGSQGPNETWVYSRTHAMMAAQLGCDPRRPLEVFDGKAWKATGAVVDLGVAAFDHGKLWLVPNRSDDSGGPIWSHFAGRWTKPSTPRVVAKVHGIAPFDGGLWVLGGATKGAAFFDGNEWTEHAFSPSSSTPSIKAAADGTAWIVDKDLWRATKGGLQKVALPDVATSGDDALHIHSVAYAANANEVWINAYRNTREGLKGRLVRNLVLLRLHGTQLTEVDVLSNFAAPMKRPPWGFDPHRTIVQGRQHIFMFRKNRIWEWVPKGSALPERVRLKPSEQLDLEVVRAPVGAPL